jgi:leucyl/phenylalanyl-tRNA--protein transferase
MFTGVSNASKVAFVTLVKRLEALDFELIDCQVHTQHLISLGAREIPRKEFIKRIQAGL